MPGRDFSQVENPLVIAPRFQNLGQSSTFTSESREALISKNPWKEGGRGEMLKCPPCGDVSPASSYTRCRTRNNPQQKQCAVYFCHMGEKEKERSVKCIEIISECLRRRRGSGELGCEGRSVDERQTFTRSSASLHFKLLFPTLRVGYLQRSLLQHSLG